MSDEQKAAVEQAANETREKATKAILDNEEAETQALRDAGMTVIGEEDGLDLAAFRESVNKLVQDRFGEKYGDLYEKIAAVA